MISCLSIPTNGRKIAWRMDLAEALAGDQRFGFFFSGNRLGDSKHHTTIKNDAEGSVYRRHNLALNFSKRDHVKARLKLMPRQSRYELTDLFL